MSSRWRVACIYDAFEDNEKEPLELYRPGYLHPIIVGDTIRPDSSSSSIRPGDSPPGYRVLHKLGHGGEATVWLAQGLEVSSRERLVSLKVYSAHCSAAAEREARALTAMSTATPDSDALWSKHVLPLLDSFTLRGPNGVHHVHVSDVILPIVCMPELSADTKKGIVRGIARGLAHLHRCGFIHGDVHIGNVGCTMPPRFASSPVSRVMQPMGSYDVMMVLPVDPSRKTASMPIYLLSRCTSALAYCYTSYGGEEAGWCPEARIYDLGNARPIGDTENDTEDVRWACPPPEAAFAHYALDGREILPTTATDVWCLGAMMTILYSNMPISPRFGKFCLVDYALLDGVLPPAWRQFWEADPELGPITVTPTESADHWSKLRDTFMQRHPDVDGVDIDRLVSLLRRMLVLDSAARPSMEEVLADPWFADPCSADAETIDAASGSTQSPT